MGCCFVDCDQGEQAARMQIQIWPPSDAEPIEAWCHQVCLENHWVSGVDSDPLEELGRIPTKALCSFCGDRLPIIGDHPYAIDVGQEAELARIWAHAECIESHIIGLID